MEATYEESKLFLTGEDELYLGRLEATYEESKRASGVASPAAGVPGLEATYEESKLYEPHRRQDVLLASLEATYEESKPHLHHGGRLPFPGLEATYEESKRVQREVAVRGEVVWKLPMRNPS